MKKVFISGSISINKLSTCLKDSIGKIISNNMEILVGDADGIDTIVQNYCKSLKYYNVTVYSIYSIPRYIVNGFNSKYIVSTIDSKKERDRQAEKDTAMTIDSEFSLIIWDGKSRGSYNNILRAIDENKKVKVYLDYEDRFFDNEKINKLEIEYIYRKNNGYSAAEVVEYLKNEGDDYIKKTCELNKILIANKIIIKEDGTYKPMPAYENLFFVEKYRGKVKGIKFKNEFINWIERWLKNNKPPEQSSFF